MKVWSRDYDAQYLLRVNWFRRFEYSTIWIVPEFNHALRMILFGRLSEPAA